MGSNLIVGRGAVGSRRGSGVGVGAWPDLGIVLGRQRPRPVHRLGIFRDLQPRDEPQRCEDGRAVLRERFDAIEGGERLDWHLASAVSADDRLHEAVAPQVGIREVEGELLNQCLARLGDQRSRIHVVGWLCHFV